MPRSPFPPGSCCVACRMWKRCSKAIFARRRSACATTASTPLIFSTLSASLARTPPWTSRAGRRGSRIREWLASAWAAIEVSLPTANFRSAFDFARAEGLRIVCHAGEIGGPSYVREAVELLGAERIGHGIAVMHDPALAEFLAMRRVVHHGKLPHQQSLHRRSGRANKKPSPTLRDHPLPEDFWPAACRDTLHRTIRRCSTHDLLSEYSSVAQLGLSGRQLPAACGAKLSVGLSSASRKAQTVRRFSRRGEIRPPAIIYRAAWRLCVLVSRAPPLGVQSQECTDIVVGFRKHTGGIGTSAPKSTSENTRGFVP